MTGARLFPALLVAFLLSAEPARADHGGPLTAAPMSPLVTALIAGGLAFVTVLLLGLVWHLLARSRREEE
jgi:hypothetical protein